MKDILKIAILDLYYGQSGKLGFYNSQAIGLAKAYKDLGHEILIVRPEKGITEPEEQLFSEKITIMSVPAKTLGVHSFYDLKFLLEKKIDLVHLNADNQAYVPAVIKFCKKHGIKMYNYVGTLYSDSESKIKQMLMSFFSVRNIRYYKKSNIFVKTEKVLQQMKAKGVSNAKVIPVGLDTEIIPLIKETKEELKEKLGLPNDKKTLLYVGRLAEYKKPMDALTLLAKMPECYLVAIGSGELKEAFLKKADELGLDERMKYIESIPNSEIHRYYKAADCFINFNHQEIFGMSILEASYQECPVVAKHAPGPDTIVDDGKTGFLCDTLEQMQECVMKISPKMGIEGKRRVEILFSWKAASRAFLEEMV